MPTKIGGPSQAALNNEFLGARGDFHALAGAIAGAIFISRDNRLHFANRASERITGYTQEELLSMSLLDIIHPDSRELLLSGESTLLVGIEREVQILAKSGKVRWLEITTATVEFEGALSSLVSGYDVTQHKKTEEQLQLLAGTDLLTGLGNYRRLVESADAEIKRSRRTGRPFAVLLLDLDQLKRINDRYGHMIGSKALCRVADALRVHCRAIDLAARYGGDEFGVILPETTVVAARLVAARIRNHLAADSRQPRLSVSTGMAVYPRDGETIEALLRAADYELYEMKSRAQNSAPRELAVAAN